jgi:hypothetical protein
MLESALKINTENAEDQEATTNMREEVEKETTGGSTFYILDMTGTETTGEIEVISTIDTIEIEKMIGANTLQKENIKGHQDHFLTRLRRVATKKEEITRRRRTKIEGALEAEFDV